MSQLKRRSGLSTFGLIWIGQLVSLIGSGLTQFGLGVWVFQETGSVTSFTLILFFATLPGGVTLVVSGVLGDRLDRRRLMLASDAVAALATIAAVVLIRMDALAVWQIYIIVTVQSMAAAFQWPVYLAVIPVLVPKRHLGRASGMIQFARAASGVAAPLLAATLLTLIGLDGVILLDLVTFVFAVGTLMFVRIPDVRKTAVSSTQTSFMSELMFGLNYIRQRRGLLSLLIYFSVVNIALAMSEVLITPMILSFKTEQTLGVVLAIGSAGMVVGSMVMSIWGGPLPRINGVLGFGAVLGLSLFFLGFRASVPLIAVAAFIRLFGLPILNGSSQTIWAEKVEANLQARMVGLRTTIAGTTAPIAYFLAGPLADKVFEPLLQADGRLADSIGRVIGTGPGRGIGLLLMVISIIPILATVVGYLSPRLRFVEDEIPDAQLIEVVGQQVI